MVTNIAAYHFVAIDEPQALALRLQDGPGRRPCSVPCWWQARASTCSWPGRKPASQDSCNTCRRSAFRRVRVKYSDSDTQPFARLKVKVKPEIITFRREDASPLQERAPSVAPADLARWIAQGHDDDGKRLVLLDTRNREEVAHGTFAGALTLPIDHFTQLPEALAPQREALADATVVSFCTGGIRCEKAAVWMRANGMDNVLQLDGGILGYFEQVGGYGYAGRCFVFDSRIALDAELRPLADNPELQDKEAA